MSATTAPDQRVDFVLEHLNPDDGGDAAPAAVVVASLACCGKCTLTLHILSCRSQVFFRELPKVLQIAIDGTWGVSHPRLIWAGGRLHVSRSAICTTTAPLPAPSLLLAFSGGHQIDTTRTRSFTTITH